MLSVNFTQNNQFHFIVNCIGVNGTPLMHFHPHIRDAMLLSNRMLFDQHKKRRRRQKKAHIQSIIYWKWAYTFCFKKHFRIKRFTNFMNLSLNIIKKSIHVTRYKLKSKVDISLMNLLHFCLFFLFCFWFGEWNPVE